MELIKHNMPDNYIVCDISDLHVGSPNVNERTIEEFVKRVKSKKNVYVVVKGDVIEAITPKDKRFNMGGLPYDTPKEQADRVIEIFKPIKNRILAWGIGNHECSSGVIDVCNFAEYITEALEIPHLYGGYEFKISFHDVEDNLMHKFFHSHGFGNLKSNAKDDIQRLANMKANLKVKMTNLAITDCIYMSMGHNHQLVVVEPTVQDKLMLTDDGKQIHQNYLYNSPQNVQYIPPDSRWYASTGSFMKRFSSPGTKHINYSERAGYAPSEIGWVEIIVKNKMVTDVKKIIA